MSRRSAQLLTPKHIQSDVTQNVDKAQGECLNQSTEHKWDNIFKKDDSFLESDTDEQLLLYIPFNQPIKIHSLCFQAPDDGTRSACTLVCRVDKSDRWSKLCQQAGLRRR